MQNKKKKKMIKGGGGSLMMTLVMSHFNFLASKYFIRPAASLLEKLSIFINFDMLISLLPTLSLEPMAGFLPN